MDLIEVINSPRINEKFDFLPESHLVEGLGGSSSSEHFPNQDDEMDDDNVEDNLDHSGMENNPLSIS